MTEPANRHPETDAGAAPVSGHRDPDGEAPWALQVVVRREKGDDETTHEAICEAVAAAVVLLLHDDRAKPGGPWHAAITRWTDGRIRKIVRRATPGARWDATIDLEHLEVTRAGVTVRAFPPGPTDNVPAQLAKLQVAGLDQPRRNPAECAQQYDVPKEVPLVAVALTPEVAITTGKAAAQAAHAAQLMADHLTAAARDAWIRHGAPLRVLIPEQGAWAALTKRVPIQIVDAGFTEIPGGTLTAQAWTTLRHTTA